MTDKRLRLPALAAFASTFFVGCAQICVGFLMIDRLDVSLEVGAQYAGFALMGVGVCLIATQIVVGMLKAIEPRAWIAPGSIVGVLGSLAIAFSGNLPLLLAGFCVSAIGMGMIFPSFQALAANAVEPHEQGAAAGAISAIQGLAMIVGPLAGTALYGVHNALPFIVTALLLGALLFALMIQRPSPGQVRPA